MATLPPGSRVVNRRFGDEGCRLGVSGHLSPDRWGCLTRCKFSSFSSCAMGYYGRLGFVVVIYGKEPTAYNKMAFIRHYWPRQKRFLNLDQELYTPRRSPALMMQ
jgi:hypothetical protein